MENINQDPNQFIQGQNYQNQGDPNYQNQGYPNYQNQGYPNYQNQYNPQNQYPPQGQPGQFLVPVGQPNVIFVNANNSNPSMERIQEIDRTIVASYQCYHCLMWFVYVVEIIVIVLAIAFLCTINDYKNAYSDVSPGTIAAVGTIDLLVAVFVIFTYYTGIQAYKERSSQKNLMFRKYLSIVFIIQCINIILTFALNTSSTVGGAFFGLGIVLVFFILSGSLQKLFEERDKILAQNKV